MASGRAIAASAAAAGHPGLDGRAVYRAHLNGADWASGLVRQSAAAVAELCGNLKSMLDPDRIVIGGGIGLAEGYLDLVHQALDEEPTLFRAPLVPAELGTHSALIGVLADLQTE